MRITTGDAHVLPGDFNLFDPAFYANGDPHSVWRVLRAESPVHWQDVAGRPGFWAVTRYQDVCDVLTRPDVFTSERGNLLTTLGHDDIAGGKMLAVTDPPRHTKLKSRLMPHFSSTAVRRLEPRLRELARRVLCLAAHEDEWDFAAQAACFPIAFTAVLMGIDERDWDRLMHFAYVAIADQDPDFGTGGRQVSALDRAHSEIFGYFAERTATATGGEDMTSTVAAIEVDGKPLSRAEVLFNTYSVLLGATVTTSHAANAGVLALAENPDEYARWTASGDLGVGVEEILRWSSPANHFLRHAVRDVEIAGTKIREGDPVTVWLGSANRDEAVFERPHRFDLFRKPNRHIAFGVGSHRCIGAPLAQLALSLLFEELQSTVERVDVRGEVRHLHSNFIAGIKSLPVRMVLRPGARERLAGLTPLTVGPDQGE